MTIEAATYISDLVATNPGANDLKAEGDDHIRLIKSAIKTTFPNVNGVVNATPAQLNYLVGVTSAIQTQISGKVSAASPALTGTATVTNAGTTYNEVVRLESGAVNSGNFSPAIAFSAANVHAAIWGARLSGFGGRLNLATQSTGGGNPVIGATLDESGGLTVVGTVTAPNFSGSLPWTSVSGRPTAVSAFANDAGYVTSIGAAAAGSLTGTSLASNVTGSSLSGLGNNVSATGTFSTTGLIYGRAGAGVGLGRITTTTTTGTPSGTSPGDLVLVY